MHRELYSFLSFLYYLQDIALNWAWNGMSVKKQQPWFNLCWIFQEPSQYSSHFFFVVNLFKMGSFLGIFCHSFPFFVSRKIFIISIYFVVLKSFMAKDLLNSLFSYLIFLASCPIINISLIYNSRMIKSSLHQHFGFEAYDHVMILKLYLVLYGHENQWSSPPRSCLEGLNGSEEY